LAALFYFAVTDERESHSFDKESNFVKSFRLSRYYSQAKIRKLRILNQPLINLKDYSFFIISRPACNQQRLVIEFELLFEFVSTLCSFGYFSGIVFQRPAYFDIIFPTADLPEAFGVNFGLGEDKAKLGENMFYEKVESVVSLEALFAQSAVRHDYGDISFAGDFNEIGPDFQLHQNTYRRIDILESTPHNHTEIEREIGHGNIILGGVQLTSPRPAGIGRGAYYDFEIVEFTLELLYELAGGVNLTDTDSVNPEAGPFRVAALYTPETTLPSAPVAVLANHPVNYHR
jgi:hypothetical protein